MMYIPNTLIEHSVNTNVHLLQLVAPVRATSAQVLGVLLDLIEATKVQEVVKLLMVLSQQSSWEVRHAALLGIQHLLAVRQVLISAHFVIFLDTITVGRCLCIFTNGDARHFEWSSGPVR